MIMRFVVSVVAVLFWMSPASAAIVGSSGDVVVAGPLASVIPPAGEQDGTIHAFDEQSSVMLPAPLTVDVSVPYTTYNPPIGRSLANIPMGTVVSSYYIHFDPETFGGVQGTVTFDEPILGVIAEGDETQETQLTDPPGDTLGPSNYLGDLTIPTLYPDNDEALGFEDGPDRVRVYESSVKVAFGASNPGDRMRVITDPNGTVLCGNGVLDAGESCDDGDIDPGDGCFGCEPEMCYTCTGVTCSPIVTCTNGDGCCAPGCTTVNDTDCLASCTKKKIKALTKKKSCFLKEFQRAAKSGAPVDVTRLGRCSGKFELAYFKAELNGGCQTNGDAPAIEAKVDAFIADLIAELDLLPLDDMNPCRVAKLKCVDQYDKCLLGLYGKGVKTGTIDPGGQAKCDLKFSNCFTKAELLGGCETTGDAAAIKAKDDAFVDDATCELQVCL